MNFNMSQLKPLQNLITYLRSRVVYAVQAYQLQLYVDWI